MPAGFAADVRAVGGFDTFHHPEPASAGTAALMVQALGHRNGQLNPLLYALQAQGAAPARDVVNGDNWGFPAHAGYDQTSGSGAMNAEKLYMGLKGYD